MKTLENGQEILTYTEAVERLDVHEEIPDDDQEDRTPRRTVHTFLDGQILLGADWDEEDVLRLLKTASEREDETDQIHATGGMSLAMGHGIMATDHRGGRPIRVFIATKPESV